MNDSLELPYCADSGAFKSCISRADVDKLSKEEIETVELRQPILCELVGGRTLKVETVVYLKLSLRTAAGPVNIHSPVECLIVDGQDEFLLGRDVLSMLGIDVDRQLELLVWSDGSDDDDIDDDPAVSRKDDDEIKEAVEAMIARASDEGFPSERVDRLRTVIYMYDIWRVNLGDDPPAKVPPLKIRLKSGAKPYKTKARKYPPELQRFLEDFNNTLESLGWVYENPDARWACPALPVKKAGGANEFRQTTDYKPTNAQVEPLVGTMPNLDVDLERVAGSLFFGLFDFIKGYWQLPLDEASQEILSYMTHRKIYTPRRVPQGCSDAALYFQATMERCFTSLLYYHLLVWIDDLLLYAKTLDEYLDKLAELFSLVNELGFKLSATKSSVFKKQVKWCGKLIDGSGVRHDPERIGALRALPYPSTAGELQQFICSTNWMRTSIIDYGRLVRPLQEKFDSVMAHTSKRTKRVASGIPIMLSAAELEAFDKLKDALAGSAMLASPKMEAETILVTDASDVGWSVIVTQVIDWKAQIPIHEQEHELLVCMGGTFTVAQRNWSVIEKEAYPIITACDKLSYLLMRPKGFRMYCDHRNLIHVFAPAQEIKKHVRGKLLRCSMKLMEYRFSIEHIEGVKNVWADMISRWAGCLHPNDVAMKRIRQKRARPDNKETKDADRGEDRGGECQPKPPPIRPFSDDSFEWPDVAAILASQKQHEAARPRGISQRNDGLWAKDECIWIPSEDRSIVQRLLVVDHCGSQGHRGRDSLMEIMQRRFSIAKLRERVDNFLRGCLMCHHVKGGRIVHRPWAETFRSNERNEALHWDYLHLGKSFGNYAYLLVMKDDATHYCELVPCIVPTSVVAAQAIMDWHSRFGAPGLWISDNGSHFKNEVVSEVSKRLNSNQKFSLAYSPWINGSVERLNKDIIQVLRAMCLEYQVDIKDWTYFVAALQANLNHTPVPSLGNHAPVELFCVLPAVSPLSFYLNEDQKRLVDLGELPDHIETKLEALRESAQLMHKKVIDARSKQTKRNQRKPKHTLKPNFDEGDFVLRSRVDQKHNDKLLVTWIGPYQVVKAEENSFRVRHLVTGAEQDVHSSRLKFYADKSFEVTEEIREHVASQGIILTVASLLEHRWNTSKHEFEILVSWKGLEPIDDSWESMTSLYKDIPVMVKNYSASRGNRAFQDAVAAMT